MILYMVVEELYIIGEVNIFERLTLLKHVPCCGRDMSCCNYFD